MRRRKPWRLYVKHEGEPSRVVAYGSRQTAERAERFEKSCGAIETRVWREVDLGA